MYSVQKKNRQSRSNVWVRELYTVNILAKMQRFMESGATSNNAEPTAIKKTRAMYQACMNTSMYSLHSI